MTHSFFRQFVPCPQLVKLEQLGLEWIWDNSNETQFDLFESLLFPLKKFVDLQPGRVALYECLMVNRKVGPIKRSLSQRLAIASPAGWLGDDCLFSV